MDYTLIFTIIAIVLVAKFVKTALKFFLIAGIIIGALYYLDAQGFISVGSILTSVGFF